MMVRLTRIPIYVGWEVIAFTPLLVFHFPRPEILSLHTTALHDPTGREVRILKEAMARAESFRLNSRAGVFALSLATWHGMRIVRALDIAVVSLLTPTDSAVDLTAADR